MHKILAILIVALMATPALAESAWDRPINRPTQKAAAHPQQATPKQLKDLRDNHVYNIATIDGALIMVENLSFNNKNSVCPDNQPKRCQKQGRLYTWESAMKACPNGWRLPTTREAKFLSTWKPFTAALPHAGYRAFNGDFYEIGQSDFFWTSEEKENYRSYAYYLAINPATGREIKAFYKDQANSVRCVKGAKAVASPWRN